MKTGCENMAPIPQREKSKREDALGRDIEYLISVFRELRELEETTGRVGLSARVRVCVTDILASADRIAQEELSRGRSSGRVRT